MDTRARHFIGPDVPGDQLRGAYDRIRGFGHLVARQSSASAQGDAVLDLLGNANSDVGLRMVFACADDKIDGISLEIATLRQGTDGSGTSDDGGGDSDFPTPPSLAGANNDALHEALDAYLQQLGSADLFSGVIAVTRSDELIYEAAVGMASKSYQVPNSVETPFRVGSITKSFIQVVMADLFERGLADPNAVVGQYLPGYPDADVRQSVSLRHLLEHSSGLASMDWPEMLASPNRLARRPEDYFPFITGRPLLFAPGTAREYSNSGYVVLGAIIEAITGRPYEDAVQELVFDRAGMTSSGFYATDRVHPGIATGYWRCQGPDGPWCVNDNILEVAGTASGGSYSTANDLLAFYSAMRAGELLPEAWTHWLFTQEWPADSSATGFDRRAWRGGWAGGAEGVSAVLAQVEDFVVVGLANYDEPSAEDVALAILRSLGVTL